MRGFVEVKEDLYEDTIEHLHRMKAIACKLIKKLEEHSELYDEEEEEVVTKNKTSKGRYNY